MGSCLCDWLFVFFFFLTEMFSTQVEVAIFHIYFKKVQTKLKQVRWLSSSVSNEKKKAEFSKQNHQPSLREWNIEVHLRIPINIQMPLWWIQSMNLYWYRALLWKVHCCLAFLEPQYRVQLSEIRFLTIHQFKKKPNTSTFFFFFLTGKTKARARRKWPPVSCWRAKDSKGERKSCNEKSR